MPASSCSTGCEPSAPTTGNSGPSSHQAARAASLYSRPMNPMTSCLGSSNRAQPSAGGRSAAASQDCFAVSRPRSQSHTDGAKAPETSRSQHPGCRPGTGLAADHVDGYTRASADRAWRDWLSGWLDLCVLRRGAGGDLPGYGTGQRGPLPLRRPWRCAALSVARTGYPGRTGAGPARQLRKRGRRAVSFSSRRVSVCITVGRCVAVVTEI